MKTLGELTITLVATDDLVVDPENARRHDEESMRRIRVSLEAFGQQKPIVLANDGKTVCAGNGTLLAARELGWSKIHAVATDLQPSQARAYAIADNRSAEAATWDDEVLTSQLAALLDEDADLFMATGFDEDELDALLGRGTTEGKTDPDAAPPTPKEPASILGAVYALGRHRLVCGDATDGDAVRAAVAGEEAMLLLTDPPYNVDYEKTQESYGGSKRPNYRRNSKRAAAGSLPNDMQSDDAHRTMVSESLRAAHDQMAAGAAFYIWHAMLNTHLTNVASEDANLPPRSCLVWVKSSLVMGRQDYQWRHEPCLYGWKGGKAHRWFNDRKQTTVLEFDKPQRSDDHPTMKPNDLWCYLIGNSSAKGDVVLDPFAGSGTTAIACEQMGRVAAMVELGPGYCDVIRRRWAEFVYGEGCEWQDLTPEVIQ